MGQLRGINQAEKVVEVIRILIKPSPIHVNQFTQSNILDTRVVLKDTNELVPFVTKSHFIQVSRLYSSAQVFNDREIIAVIADASKPEQIQAGTGFEPMTTEADKGHTLSLPNCHVDA